MKAIYKYPIDFATSQILAMPVGADIISVQMQNGILTIWAIISTEVSLIPVTIRIFGTGKEIPVDLVLRHVGSIRVGIHVWHVFIDVTL